MSIVLPADLNHLLSHWPNGQVYSRAYLHKQGYGDHHLQKYVRAGWIERIGIGAYKKPSDVVDWQAGLHAIQMQLKLPIHVGGRTAIVLSGKGQYLELGQMELRLLAPRKCPLPSWFKKHSWSVAVRLQESTLFKESINEFGQKENGFTRKEYGQVDVVISAPERAIMEYLDKLPSQGTYKEALELMENLISLRSGVVQNLLEKCDSVKVKRLFLHLAEKVNHTWFKKLELSKVDTGTGKRVIFKNGLLDPKYKITIPRDVYEEQSF